MTNAEVYGMLSYLLQEIEKLNKQFMVLLQGQECSAVPEEEIKKKLKFVKEGNSVSVKQNQDLAILLKILNSSQ